jgi:hypothetical protein
MGGTVIIVGDKPLVDTIEANLNKVAVFRRQRATAIIAEYKANENSITRDDQQFLLRCAADIVDNG